MFQVELYHCACIGELDVVSECLSDLKALIFTKLREIVACLRLNLD
jgi:hypothetical protein